MFTAFLWFGTAFIALWLGLLIWGDIRFRTSGRHIQTVARVTGHRSSSGDGDTMYFDRLTFTDHRGATHEFSGSSASRRGTPIGTQIPIHYPEDRPDLPRELNRGCVGILFYVVGITMLLAFAAAAMLGFGAGLGG